LSSDPAQTLVFVYGTLKRGLSNSHYLRGQTFVAEAVTLPVYRMVDAGGYPGMFPETGGGLPIKGEIWSVDEACRRQLDLLEDVAIGLYELVPVSLQPPYDTLPVLTYLYKWPVAGRRDLGEEWLEK
jgi:gamma-glutamylcyclotransferase (GGCT)/AIG2-like uncharacterized protein YtfP